MIENDYYGDRVTIGKGYGLTPLLEDDGRGYKVWLCTFADGTLRISAGCRFFTIENAIKHWSDPKRALLDPRLAFTHCNVLRRDERYLAGEEILAAVRKLALTLPPQGERQEWPVDHWVTIRQLGPGVTVEQSDRYIRTRYETDCRGITVLSER